jgi:hypothetical protein
MENSNDTIVNRTRDLAACSAVPEPRAVVSDGKEYKMFIERIQLFVV